MAKRSAASSPGGAATAPPLARLIDLRNIGKRMCDDFRLLGVTSVAQLAEEDADDLYERIAELTGGALHDPCVHDTYAAAIHQAKTGEALSWWAFTPARKERQKKGTFVSAPPKGKRKAPSAAASAPTTEKRKKKEKNKRRA